MAKLTKAAYARFVGHVLRRVARESEALAEGAWNPLFCASDAKYDADAFCEEIRAQLDHIARLSVPTLKEMDHGED